MRSPIQIRVFWDVAPFSLVGADRRFIGAYCLHHQGDKCIQISGRNVEFTHHRNLLCEISGSHDGVYED
jgi:hypothetical protein